MRANGKSGFNLDGLVRRHGGVSLAIWQQIQARSLSPRFVPLSILRWTSYALSLTLIGSAQLVYGQLLGVVILGARALTSTRKRSTIARYVAQLYRIAAFRSKSTDRP
jgi:hypothetical protein